MEAAIKERAIKAVVIVLALIFFAWMGVRWRQASQVIAAEDARREQVERDLDQLIRDQTYGR